ncbi:MAG TPA: ATP-binding cassette domain-containing protein, partial [Acidimicrobiia bacterium]
MIIARGLTVEAGIRTLVSDASFALHPGDKVGLVGRNGAGKTTLLRTLAGRLEPVAGTIARSGVIGYLSQEASLPELDHADATGLERILGARDIGGVQRRMEATRRAIEGADGEERDRLIRRYARLEDEFQVAGGYRAEAEARRFGASIGVSDEEMAQPVRTMSGGQRRRVELARILFAETEVLLLDEPTNHLDLESSDALLAAIDEFDGAVIMVTHNERFLHTLAERLVVFQNGGILV